MTIFNFFLFAVGMSSNNLTEVDCKQWGFILEAFIAVDSLIAIMTMYHINRCRY